MKGEEEPPPDPQDPICAAELCPKCLGLVMRGDGVCKQCGERVFPSAIVRKPSAEDQFAIVRKCVVITIGVTSLHLAIVLHETGSRLAQGDSVSARKWIDLICAAVVMTLWIVSWRELTRR